MDRGYLAWTIVIQFLRYSDTSESFLLPFPLLLSPSFSLFFLSSIPSFSFLPPFSPFSPSLQQAFTENLKSVWHSAKHWGYIDKHCFYPDGPWVLSIFSLLLYTRMSFFFPFSPKCNGNGNERNSHSLLVFQ